MEIELSEILVITGSEYSGWDAVARFFCKIKSDDALLTNSAVSSDQDLALELTANRAETDAGSRPRSDQLTTDNTAGWVDGDSVKLLGLWATVNQDYRFLFVYSSPEETFARVMREHRGDRVRVDEVMAHWEMTSRAILNCFQNNRDRSLLVHVHSLYEQSDELRYMCSDLLGRELPVNEHGDSWPCLSVIEANAALLLPNYDDLHGLYDEMQGAASLSGRDINLSGITDKRKTKLAEAGIIEYLQAEEDVRKIRVLCSDLEIRNSQLEDELASTSEQLRNQRVAMDSNYLQVVRELESCKQENVLRRDSVEDLETQLELYKIQLVKNKEEMTLQLTSYRDQFEGDRASLVLEKELSELQLKQLEEEIESLYSDNKVLKSQLESELELTSQYKSKIYSLSEDHQVLIQKQDINVLQIHQLQEELEALYNDHKVLKSQFESELELTSQYKSKISTLNEEHQVLMQDQDINVLQIHQLQEELEYYYGKYEYLRDKAIVVGDANTLYRSTELSTCRRCEIISTYSEDGYEDLSLKIVDLVSSYNQSIDSLQFKLLLKDTMLGLEIREDVSRDENQLLNWPEGMVDEHGPYLLYIPSPNDDLRAQQAALVSKLSTSDRQLIEVSVSVIADCFMSGSVDNSIEIESSEIKKWRHRATQLVGEVREHNQFVSVNSVSLNEEFRIEGYEHLWLQCNGFQIGQQFFPDFNFKLTAASSVDEFAEQLFLEFRELPGGRPPFQSWPPNERDEFGAKLLAMFCVRGDKTYVDVTETMTDEDVVFLSLLIQKVPTILAQLERNGVLLERAWSDWHNRVSQLVLNDVIVGSEPRGVSQKLKGLLRRINGSGRQ